jgi:hypothetical protein
MAEREERDDELWKPAIECKVVGSWGVAAVIVDRERGFRWECAIQDLNLEPAD